MPHVLQRTLWVLPWLVLTTGCASLVPRLYTTPIRQGNYIDPATVAQLHPGMTRQQVQQRMGIPLVANPFHPDRWEYYYQYMKMGQMAEQRHVTLIFRGDTLDHVEQQQEQQ